MKDERWMGEEVPSQQRIRLGDPVIPSRTGARDRDRDLDQGPGLFSAVRGEEKCEVL